MGSLELAGGLLNRLQLQEVKAGSRYFHIAALTATRESGEETSVGLLMCKGNVASIFLPPGEKLPEYPLFCFGSC